MFHASVTMAQGGGAGDVKKGSFEIQPGSIPMEELSTTFRELVNDGKHKVNFNGQYWLHQLRNSYYFFEQMLIDGVFKACVKRMERGGLKIGRIFVW